MLIVSGLLTEFIAGSLLVPPGHPWLSSVGDIYHGCKKGGDTQSCCLGMEGFLQLLRQPPEQKQVSAKSAISTAVAFKEALALRTWLVLPHRTQGGGREEHSGGRRDELMALLLTSVQPWAVAKPCSPVAKPGRAVALVSPAAVAVQGSHHYSCQNTK
jgi:hypothetical protein